MFLSYLNRKLDLLLFYIYFLFITESDLVTTPQNRYHQSLELTNVLKLCGNLLRKKKGSIRYLID